MGVIKFVIKINKLTRRIIILSLFFLVIGTGGYLGYRFLDMVWHTMDTWQSGLFDTPFPAFPGYKFSYKVDKKAKNVTVKVDYALLYKIHRDGKKATYYFSFVPYSEVLQMMRDMPASSLRKRLKGEFVFTVPDVNHYKPQEFLDHKLLSVDSYTHLFAGDPVAIPARVELRINMSRYLHPSVKDLIRHAYVVYVKHSKDILPEQLLSWRVSKLRTAAEYFKNANDDQYDVYLDKWAQKVTDWYTGKVKNALHVFDVTQTAGRVEFFNNIVDLFSGAYQKCDKNKCVSNGSVSPGASYMLYLYTLYYRDHDLFTTLKEATYKHFINYHPKVTEGGTKDKWGFIVPYVAPVAPVGLTESDKELKEFFLDTYNIFIKDVKDLVELQKIQTPGQTAIPLLGWSGAEVSLAVSNYNSAAYYKYVKGKVYIPKDNYEHLPKASRALLHALVLSRIYGRAMNFGEGKFFVLDYPYDKKALAYYIYSASEFNPYNGPFLQASRNMVVNYDNSGAFLPYQDKILSLLLAYEISIAK